GDSRFSARKIYSLNEIKLQLKAGITIQVDGSNPRMELLQKAMEYMKKSSGSGDVIVDIRHKSGWKVRGLSRSIRVYPDGELMDKLRELLGRESVILSRGKGPRI
ncbi:MAG: hypothetical protein KAT09_07905, partial [Candidatus Aegiribacteria sp.]|nr:hypothetical protein [Candidatus Aegiribacteria sp.]